MKGAIYMQDTIQTLFERALDERIPAYLVGEEYEESTRILERQEAHFLSLLSPDESRKLEEYFSEAAYKTTIKLEAAFRAGFSMAMDLVRV